MKVPYTGEKKFVLLYELRHTILIDGIPAKYFKILFETVTQ